MTIAFNLDIFLHVFYSIVIIFGLWSMWVWNVKTFPYFVWLKIVPGTMIAMAVFLELIHCGIIVLN